MNYQEEYNDYWSRQDRWGSHSFDDANGLFRRISLISEHGSVLDVGCGMGLLVRTFLNHGREAHGIDIALRVAAFLSASPPRRIAMAAGT